MRLISCVWLATCLSLTALLLTGPPRLQSAVVTVGAARSAVQAVPEPTDDETAEQALLGQRAMEQNCLMCHSIELIQSQRLNPTQWTAEVDKMMGWGAPVPPEDRERLIQHLIRSYPPDRPPAAPQRLSTADLRAIEPTSAPATVSGDLARGAQLYATHCASCHGPTARGGDLGTCLAGRPVLVSNPTYERVVREGLRRMPGFAETLPPQAQADILAWLRQQ